MSELLLLDPYRSAVIARAFDEDLLQGPPDVKIQGAPLFKIGDDRKFQDSVLQMALLFDSLLVIQHEEGGRDNPVNTLSLRPLVDEGVLNFATAPSDFDRVAQSARSLEDIWRLEDSNFRLWSPLVAPMLTAKGVLPHPSLLYLLRAKRLGLETTQIAQSVPYRFNREREEFLAGAINPLRYDLPVFIAINEAEQAKSIVDQTLCRVAHNAPIGTHPLAEGDLNLGAETLFKVALSTLLEFNLEFPFPCPRSVKEMVEMRAHRAIVTFRETFAPWLVALSNGSQNEERRLRGEIKEQISNFKTYHRWSQLKALADMFGLLPLGLGDALATALNLVNLGLGDLAGRLNQNSKWVGFCRPVQPPQN